MVDLLGCNKNLTVLIETEFKDWSFIYDIVTDIDINISNSPHQHPIPYGTEITDHVKRNMDRITITGIIGCYRCGGFDMTTNYVIPELKKLADRMMYCIDDFVLLTSNDWQARYMILTDVSVKERYDKVQVKEITTTWIGANLTGSIGSPAFKQGGIQY